MFKNGLYLVPDLAVKALGDPLAVRYRKSLILGSLREDVIWVPWLGLTEYPSFSHFYKPGLPGGYLPFLWPGPRWNADRLFARAVEAERAGKTAYAFVLLGRIAHLLCDMSIPSHANRAVHQTDAFEWWVEGNTGELESLVVPELPAAERASELIESLARRAQPFTPDRTNYPLGRLLKRLGLRKSVLAKEAAEQARQLIPHAVAHTMALLKLFLRTRATA